MQEALVLLLSRGSFGSVSPFKCLVLERRRNKHAEPVVKNEKKTLGIRFE